MTTVSRLISAVCACFAALIFQFSAFAAAPEPSREQLKFFEEKVRPILAENCYKCHGSEKQKGSLRLDVPEMALAGGESGPAIVPGKPDKSPLVEAIKWESLEMPPTGNSGSSGGASETSGGVTRGGFGSFAHAFGFGGHS